jgi:hypothetical protein
VPLGSGRPAAAGRPVASAASRPIELPIPPENAKSDPVPAQAMHFKNPRRSPKSSNIPAKSFFLRCLEVMTGWRG